MKSHRLTCMKFPVILIAIVILLLAACSPQDAVIGTASPDITGPSTPTPSPTPLPSASETARVAPTAKLPPSITPGPEPTYNGAKLYDKPVSGKINIGIVPTALRVWPRHYYVPNEVQQKELLDLVKGASNRSGHYCVITIAYGGEEWYVEKGTALFEYAFDLARNSCGGITLINPADICELTSAQMNYTIRDEKGVQMIDDPDQLWYLAQRLSSATELDSGTKCPFNEALLTLTRKDGRQIIIRLATDSCAVYFHDGQYFDYGGSNEDVLMMFDEARWPSYYDE